MSPAEDLVKITREVRKPNGNGTPTNLILIFEKKR